MTFGTGKSPKAAVFISWIWQNGYQFSQTKSFYNHLKFSLILVNRVKKIRLGASQKSDFGRV